MFFFPLLGIGEIVNLAKSRESEVVDKLPIVRVGIGMALKDMQAGSTFSFEVEEGKESDTQLLYVLQPYNFIYVDGDKELSLKNTGGEGFLTVVMVTNDHVDNLNVTAQNSRLTLDEALARAEYFYNWFQDAGFKLGENPRLFYINRLKGGYFSKPINSFSEARVSLLDATEKIEQMDLFSLAKGDRAVNLNLKNSRRMKAQLNKKLDDESHAQDEREYYLNLFITARR